MVKVEVGTLAHGQNTLREDADNLVKVLLDKYGSSLERVVLFPDDATKQTVRLAVVMSGTDHDGDDKELIPIRFPKEPGDAGNRKDGIQHPSEVIECSSAQWDSVRHGKPKLPDGWDVSRVEEIFPAKG